VLTERHIRRGDAALNLASGPAAGPPLLFLHGVTRRWQDFLPLVPGLAPRWTIHALDFRGHGKSSRAPGRYLVCDYVGDAVAAIDALAGEPLVLYGHSLGAMVAAVAAGARPDRVRGVVLEDPPFDTLGSRIGATPFHAFFAGVEGVLRSGIETVEAIAARLAEIRTPALNADGSLGPATVRLGDVRDPTALRFSARCLLDVDPEVLAPIVAGRWLDGYRREAILRGIECPALLLQGDTAAGGMLPDADAAEALGRLRRGALVKLPRTGHLLHWLETPAVLRLATGFLESL
jgi:pimeloyl-ACP methyl ester carboxylesterase